MFNSFGFITIVVFVFAFLSTMAFPSTDAGRKRAVAHTLAQYHRPLRSVDVHGIPVNPEIAGRSGVARTHPPVAESLWRSFHP